MNNISHNTAMIANIVALTKAVLLKGDGQGYTIPEEYKSFEGGSTFDGYLESLVNTAISRNEVGGGVL